MSKFIGFSVFALLSCIYSSAYAEHECDSWASGYSVGSVIEDGKTVKLTDGSIWRIEDEDMVVAARWVPNTKIEICDGNKLTNTEDAETVHAKQMK